MSPLARQRLVILGVVTIFAAPVLAAMFLNSEWTDWRPAGTKNFGDLVEPPVLLPPMGGNETTGQWRVLYLDRSCEDGCEARAKSWQRLYRATGRHMEEVRPVIALESVEGTERSQALKSLAPDVEFVSNLPPAWFNTVGDAVGGDPYGRAVIVDPRGYVALQYPEADAQHVLKDLKRLLTWSKE